MKEHAENLLREILQQYDATLNRDAIPLTPERVEDLLPRMVREARAVSGSLQPPDVVMHMPFQDETAYALLDVNTVSSVPVAADRRSFVRL